MNNRDGPDRDDNQDDGDESAMPDTDPQHIDPAGDVADLVESGDLELELDTDQDEDELREFLERAEAGEFGADPGLEATVRIARTLLESDEND